MRTAILSVAYPAAEIYFSDFFRSLANQSDRDFDVLIVDEDGSQSASLLAQAPRPRTLAASGTPAALRKLAIQWAAQEGWEAVIFADIDDYFDPQRASVSKSLLASADVVCNELLLVGNGIPQPIPLLGPRFKEGQQIGARELANSNCLGLSNTAARLGVVGAIAPGIPDSLAAFDWALFAQALISGADAVFTARTCTYYRQHVHNTAGILACDDEQILRGVRVKAEHYALLSGVDDWYAAQAQEYALLSAHLASDVSFRKVYCSLVRNKRPVSPCLWWELIRLEPELL